MLADQCSPLSQAPAAGKRTGMPAVARMAGACARAAGGLAVAEGAAYGRPTVSRRQAMSKTTLLFRDDPYARTAEATVVGIDDNGGIVLDRTIFYAQGGGQPGDVGWITLPDGGEIAIANAVYGPDRSTVA